MNPDWKSPGVILTMLAMAMSLIGAGLSWYNTQQGDEDRKIEALERRVGDAMLRQKAELIRNMDRNSDEVKRIIGDATSHALTINNAQDERQKLMFADLSGKVDQALSRVARIEDTFIKPRVGLKVDFTFVENRIDPAILEGVTIRSLIYDTEIKMITAQLELLQEKADAASPDRQIRILEQEIRPLQIEKQVLLNKQLACELSQETRDQCWNEYHQIQNH